MLLFVSLLFIRLTLLFTSISSLVLSLNGLVNTEGRGTADAVAVSLSLVLLPLGSPILGLTASAFADPSDCYALFMIGQRFRMAIR